MLIGWILTFLALAQVALGLRFIFRYERSPGTMWFGLFMVASSIYVAGNGLGFIHAIPGQIAEHVAWAGGIMAAIFFLPFSYVFPLPRKPTSFLIAITAWPFFVFVPAILWTDLFIKQMGVVRFGEGYTTDQGPYFYAMIVFFGIYFIWAITNLVIRFRHSDGIHRWQLRTLLTGIILSLIISSFFDIYMPLTHVIRYGWVGSMFTTVWFGYTGYILLKK